MDYNTDGVQIKRLMLRNAKQGTLLCDYSKFYRSALVNVCIFPEVDVLINGNELDSAFLQQLGDHNIQVVDPVLWRKSFEPA